jgi:hypothetical protein
MQALIHVLTQHKQHWHTAPPDFSFGSKAAQRANAAASSEVRREAELI